MFRSAEAIRPHTLLMSPRKVHTDSRRVLFPVNYMSDSDGTSQLPSSSESTPNVTPKKNSFTISPKKGVDNLIQQFERLNERTPNLPINYDVCSAPVKKSSNYLTSAERINTITTSSFYGSQPSTQELIRKLRFQRNDSYKPRKICAKLFDDCTVKNGKRKHEKENHARAKKPRDKIKIFSGVGHRITKPKKRKAHSFDTPVDHKRPKTSLVAPSFGSLIDNKRPKVNLVKKAKPKWDKDLIPEKPGRIELDQETAQKRKFFKSTVSRKLESGFENTSLSKQVDTFRLCSRQPHDDFKDVSDDIIGMIEDDNDERTEELKKTVNMLVNQLNPTCRKDAYTPKNTPGYSYILPSIGLSPIDKVSISNSFPTYAFTPKTDTDENVNESEMLTPPRSKYYPIFEPRKERTPLSAVINRGFSDNGSKRRKANKFRGAAMDDHQYQIDAGQKIFAHIECADCGMFYDPTDLKDVEFHRRSHEKDFIHKAWKEENIVWKSENDRIITVNCNDKQRKRERAMELLKCTEKDIGSTGPMNGLWTLYIYIRKKNILGIALVEPILKARRVVPGERETIKVSDQIYEAKCGINRIWIHQDHRRIGIGTRLVDSVRNSFKKVGVLDIDELAFSGTTLDGDNFAKSYCKRPDYLLYTT